MSAAPPVPDRHSYRQGRDLEGSAFREFDLVLFGMELAIEPVVSVVSRTCMCNMPRAKQARLVRT